MPTSSPSLFFTGQQGPTGAIGSVGATGAAGVAGATGIAGAKGLTGAAGATGATGPDGETGVEGAEGAIGATGRHGVIGYTNWTTLYGVTDSVSNPSGAVALGDDLLDLASGNIKTITPSNQPLSSGIATIFDCVIHGRISGIAGETVTFRWVACATDAFDVNTTLCSITYTLTKTVTNKTFKLDIQSYFSNTELQPTPADPDEWYTNTVMSLWCGEYLGTPMTTVLLPNEDENGPTCFTRLEVEMNAVNAANAIYVDHILGSING
jgi:hypothetical protein